jgi:threonine aldolase
MYYFNSDYTEGCHPDILAKLAATNMDQTTGYGLDPYCDEARELIKKAFACPQADVHFLVGGTQTNLTVICAALRPHQAVYGAVPSHINTHEAGAIEHVGHRVLPLPSADGKLTAEQIAEAWKKYDTDPSREHWAQPKMVYISQPTEIGSMYSKKELSELYSVCRAAGLYLFIDGARLGYALGTPSNDLTMADIAANCDVFSIGGTKCGLLFGEAVVILNDELKPDFRTIAKQNGAILAKGRLLGVQFAEAFRNNLYTDICQKGTMQALKIKQTLIDCGFSFVTDSPTNQQFVIMTPQQYEKLSQDFVLSLIEYLPDGNYSVRICTSWATLDAEVDKLIETIKTL